MNVKEYLLDTAFQILETEQATQADKELAKKVRIELGAQRTWGRDLVLVLYETASAGGYLMDRAKLFRKEQIMNMPGNPHLDLIAEEWDQQAIDFLWRNGEPKDSPEYERYYQIFRYDPEIGISHLFCEQYSEALCAALSSLVNGLLQPLRWRHHKEDCLSSEVYGCQPKERVYRLLTRHLKTEPHWNSRAIRSEMMTRKPYWPSCAPIYDNRDHYLAQYPCLLSLYSNMQLYRRVRDIQKAMENPASEQVHTATEIDLSLIHEPYISVGHEPVEVDWDEMFSDDGDLPMI